MFSRVGPALKATKNWFKRYLKRFRVRSAENILEAQRAIFERYGEQVIAAMLAGGLKPSTKDLVAVYEDDVAKEHAAGWLTECSDYKDRHDAWIELRDLLLELAIVLLILWEIKLSVQQEKDQVAN